MKLFIAGHQGMVGGALVRRFGAEPGVSLVTRTRRELDLTNQAAVEMFFSAEKPDVAIIAAAKVGGITRTTRIRRSFSSTTSRSRRTRFTVPTAPA